MDGQDSDTSTPGYKRGRHGNPHNHGQSGKQWENAELGRGAPALKHKRSSGGNTAACGDLEQKDEQRDLSPRRLVKHIKSEGMAHSTPAWLSQQVTSKSLLILSDSQMKYWLDHDKVCHVEFRLGWPLNRWAQAVRRGIIKVDFRTVVPYLEATNRWQDVPPIKNVLHTLCKAIWSLGNNSCIFVVNHLPLVNMGSSPLCNSVTSNFILQQATCSVGRALRGGYSSCPCMSTLCVQKTTRSFNLSANISWRRVCSPSLGAW